MQLIEMNNISVLVLGDIMLDHFIYGTVERISPEAPVPVVNVSKESDILGGCGNIINNLFNIGVSINVISVLGGDAKGKKIINKLSKLGIDIDNLYESVNMTTTYKMRIIADRQHIVRADWEGSNLTERQEKEILSSLDNLLPRCDGIIISDYGKGLCTNNIVTTTIQKARESNIPIFIDPKGKDWHKYSGATFITPNTNEVSSINDHKLSNDNDFEDIGNHIIETYAIDHCLITRGSEGMTLVSRDDTFHVTSNAKEVFDVSGAGDTVISCLAAAILNGDSLRDAVNFSNKAAGIVVGHVGTAPISKEELKNI